MEGNHASLKQEQNRLSICKAGQIKGKLRAHSGQIKGKKGKMEGNHASW